jgi:hypothetical protein
VARVDLGNSGQAVRVRVGLVGVGNTLDWSHGTSWSCGWSCSVCNNPSFLQVAGELSDFQVAGGGSGWKRWLS